jgi:hypothetical protein
MKKNSWRCQEQHFSTRLEQIPRRIRKDAHDLIRVFLSRKSKKLRLCDNYLIKLWECSRATAQRRLTQLEELGFIRRWTSNPQKVSGGWRQFRFLLLVSQKKTQTNRDVSHLNNNKPSAKLNLTPLSFEDYLSIRQDVPLRSFLFWMRKWKCNPRTIGYITTLWKQISNRADVLESILWSANDGNLIGKKRVGFILSEIKVRT